MESSRLNNTLKFSLVAFLFISFAMAAAKATAGSLDSGPWPTQNHDNRRSNQSQLHGPAATPTATLIYDAVANSNPGGNPGVHVVVGSDGKIVVGGCESKVDAINLDGTPFWSAPFQLATSPYQESATGFTISSSGNIYISDHECPDVPGGVLVNYYALSPSGSQQWATNGNAMYYPPAVADDGSGTLYQMDEFNNVNAYDPATGAKLWPGQHLPFFSQGAVALDSNGYLYIGTDGAYIGANSLYSLDPAQCKDGGSGCIRWSKSLNGSLAPKTPAVSTGNVIYIASDAGDLYAYNPDGSSPTGWSTPFSTGASSSGAPLAVGNSGTVYFKTSAGLFAINPDKTLKWQFAPGGDAIASGSPIIDVDANVYVAFGDTVYSLNDADGSIRWQLSLPNVRSLAIGADGVLLAGTTFVNATGTTHDRLYRISPPRPLIVGLGDSVAAGYGLGVDGNAASYPQLLVNGWGAQHGWSGFNAAQSGALSGGCFRSDIYRGNCHSVVRTQLPFVTALKPDMVTLTVGANDINFGQCLESLLTGQSLNLNPCSNRNPAFGLELNSLSSNLQRIFTLLHQSNPHVTILVTHYYDPLPPGPAPRQNACLVYYAAAIAGGYKISNLSQFQHLAVSLQQEDYQFAQTVLRELDQDIDQAAKPYPYVHVIPVDAAFDNHDFCEPDDSAWMQGPWYDIAQSLVSYFGGVYGVAALPYLCPNPRAFDTTAAFSNPVLDVYPNCTPHPTFVGQVQLAKMACETATSAMGLSSVGCSQ